MLAQRENFDEKAINSLTASPYFIPQPPEARLLLNLGVFGTSLAPKLINLS